MNGLPLPRMGSATITVVKPYTPPPPVPPVPPSSTVTLAQCGLCGALLNFGQEHTHLEWHRKNGLHGMACQQLDGLIAQEAAINGGMDVALAIQPCNCGVDDKKDEH